MWIAEADVAAGDRVRAAGEGEVLSGGDGRRGFRVPVQRGDLGGGEGR